MLAIKAPSILHRKTVVVPADIDPLSPTAATNTKHKAQSSQYSPSVYGVTDADAQAALPSLALTDSAQPHTAVGIPGHIPSMRAMTHSTDTTDTPERANRFAAQSVVLDEFIDVRLSESLLVSVVCSSRKALACAVGQSSR